jgi:hypothetical protein
MAVGIGSPWAEFPCDERISDMLKKLFMGAVRRNWQALLLLLFWEFPKQLVTDRIVGGTNTYIDKHSTGVIVALGKTALFILQTPFLIVGLVLSGILLHAYVANPRTRRKSYTNRTVTELLGLFSGRTITQGNRLLEPYTGLFMKVTGQVGMVTTYGQKGGVVLRTTATGGAVDARFENGWTDALGRINTNDTVTIHGRIADHQNGQQLYLVDCELEDTA